MNAFKMIMNDRHFNKRIYQGKILFINNFLQVSLRNEILLSSPSDYKGEKPDKVFSVLIKTPLGAHF